MKTAVALTIVAAVGCVPGVEPRSTPSEAALGPPPAPEAPSAATLLAPNPGSRPERAPSSPKRQGGRWVEGYWHWDGVRYVWIHGRSEPAPSAYRWAWPSLGSDRGRR